MTNFESTPITASERLAQIDNARVLEIEGRGSINGERGSYRVLVLSDETRGDLRVIRLIARGHDLNVLIQTVGANRSRNSITVTDGDGRVRARGIEVIGASGMMATAFNIRRGGDAADFTTPDAHIILAAQYGLADLGYI